MRQTILFTLMLLIVACQKQESSTTHPFNASAQDNTVTKDFSRATVYIAASEYNPCSGEEDGHDVLIEGYEHFMFHIITRTNKNNVPTMTGTAEERDDTLTITDAIYGTQYFVVAFIATTKFTAYWDATEQGYVLDTYNVNSRLVAKAAPDSYPGGTLYITEHLHFVILPDGTVKAKTTFTSECKR
jgi:hypothetical protein